jgi:hypothetical protein
MNLMNIVKRNDEVFFIPDNRCYTVEEVEPDVVYLIDDDGSSFTATVNELRLN